MAPFFYSFGPGLFVIRILADWWKVRLYLPLTTAQRTLRSTTANMMPSSADMLTQLKTQYSAMDFDSLTKELNASAKSSSLDPEAQSILETAFKSKVQQKIHIHHFIFGIPSMFVSWCLFAFGQGWWGWILAGITAALFLSELKELITQQWEP